MILQKRIISEVRNFVNVFIFKSTCTLIFCFLDRIDSESSTLSDSLLVDLEDVIERLFLLQVFSFSHFSYEFLSIFLLYKAQEGIVCQAELPTSRTHFSNLPPEIITIIIKWVVGKHLDIESLENLGMVCRGLFVCSRDEKIWKAICQQFVFLMRVIYSVLNINTFFKKNSQNLGS